MLKRAMPSEAYAPLAIAACLGAFSIYASWRASRPANPMKPRLLPWRTLFVFGSAVTLIVLAYAVHFLLPNMPPSPMAR